VALDFDGEDDFVMIPYDSSLDGFSELTVLADFTVRNYTGKFSHVVGKGPWADGSFLMHVRDDGVLQFGIQLGGNRYTVGTKNFDLGRDIKARGVYDGESLEIYVDGNLEGTRKARGVLSLESHLRISHEANPLSGVVRKVSIFDRAVRP